MGKERTPVTEGNGVRGFSWSGVLVTAEGICEAGLDKSTLPTTKRNRKNKMENSQNANGVAKAFHQFLLGKFMYNFLKKNMGFYFTLDCSIFGVELRNLSSGTYKTLLGKYVGIVSKGKFVVGSLYSDFYSNFSVD